MTDLAAKLVFGTGGRFGRLSFPLAQSLVDTAIRNGIYSFDTGYFYANQKSQKLLFRCLDKWFKTEYSSSIKISTKIPALPPDQFSHLLNNTLRDLPVGAHINSLFVWGPSSSDLSDPLFLDCLSKLKSTSAVYNLGVNTHDFLVMCHMIDNASIWDQVMVDYNLVQLNRELLFNSFSEKSIKVWAGTALCQGFLLQNLFSLGLRTRSASYLGRAFMHKPTRILRKRVNVLRQIIQHNYPEYASILPLLFVLSNEMVSYVPVGMLSEYSIQRNVSACQDPVPKAILRDVWLKSQSLLCDVF